MLNITKKFGDFTANDNINLIVEKGEIHALLGENGAGKSTLMNVLYGLYRPTSGTIKINGEVVEMANPNIAISKGLGMVHQHFMLVETFTVVENIILGMEVTKAGNVVLDTKKASKDIKELSDHYGLRVDPDALVSDISVGMQQRVEILKALYRGADILILDEPTAVLTPQEIDELTEIVKNLASEGKTIILITHKLKEIKDMADKCTIIRRGKYIDTVNIAEVTERDLAAMMVGRDVNFKVNKIDQEPGETVLDIKDIVVKDFRNLERVKGLSLEVKKGEVFGVAGIDGNGQSELIEALTGLRKIESGTVLMNGKDITNHTPHEIQDTGLYNIPEDRQRRGLVMDFTVAENLILENYDDDQFSNGWKLKHKEIDKHAEELSEKFDIRPRKISAKANELSGGNQQKVIIAREITNDPELLIATQPTRGLDVGAIEYVHEYLVDQRNEGKAVLLVSFELDEILSLSDRIGVIYDGQIVSVMEAEDTNERELGYLMAGGNVNEKAE
ncbi:MAG: ABC transporter ATP-binding protein [Tissierellia bacterium]|nr:ABC transporter ATP-binding protein [Tissierellia bacterium]